MPKRGPVPRSLADRFWEKVNKHGRRMPHMRTICHEWRAAACDGYGRIRLTDVRKTALAHRVAWFLRTGLWPSLHLLHECDNPSCVRFEHLREGTDADNTADKIKRGRGQNPNGLGNRTHCSNGHEFTSENTTIKGTARLCRQCARDRQTRFRLRKAAA